MSSMLVFAAVAALQGQAVLLRLPVTEDTTAVAVDWRGKHLPMTRSGGHWQALIGIDLDMSPGPYAAVMTQRLADGAERIIEESVVVSAGQYRTTELTVARQYVDLSEEDQQRAARESEKIAAIYANISAAPLWDEPFAAPIEGASGGRNFGHRRVFNGQARAPHSGADLSASVGTPVRAANRGRVVLAEPLFFSGNAVFLDHGLGVYSVYLHLSEIKVSVGELVEKTALLGLAGATGRVTGPHLHWGVRVLDARVDPFTLPGMAQD